MRPGQQGSDAPERDILPVRALPLGSAAAATALKNTKPCRDTASHISCIASQPASISQIPFTLFSPPLPSPLSHPHPAYEGPPPLGSASATASLVPGTPTQWCRCTACDAHPLEPSNRTAPAHRATVPCSARLPQDNGMIRGLLWASRPVALLGVQF